MNSFERRIRAFSIDMSFSTVLFLILVFIVNLIGIENSTVKLLLSASIAYYGVLLVPNLISRGQTFGKRNQKMRVVNIKTNEVPNLAIVLLREIVKGTLMIASYGVYLLICGIMVNSRKDGRSIHDLIFQTKVIPITRYVSDKDEGYVLGQGASAKKNLEGSSHD